MQFNSYFFILVFLPCFLLAFFILKKIDKRFGKVIIIISSVAFYLYGSVYSALVLGISIAVNFLLSFIIIQTRDKRCHALSIAVLLNVLVLFYYKYALFAVGTINKLVAIEFTLKETIVPLGISFFTFQQIMFLVSVQIKEIEELRDSGAADSYKKITKSLRETGYWQMIDSNFGL